MNTSKLKFHLKWCAISSGVFLATMAAVAIAIYTYTFGLHWVGLDKEAFKLLVMVSWASAGMIYMSIYFLYMFAVTLTDASKGAVAWLKSVRQPQ